MREPDDESDLDAWEEFCNANDPRFYVCMKKIRKLRLEGHVSQQDFDDARRRLVEMGRNKHRERARIMADKAEDAFDV